MTDQHFTVDEARSVVTDALRAHIEKLGAEGGPQRDLALAKAMAENVTAWTHTTRVRDFVRRTPVPLIAVLENAEA